MAGSPSRKLSLPAPSAQGQLARGRLSKQSQLAMASMPMASARGVNANPPSHQSNLNQTYEIDVVQTVRVTSNEPLTRRDIDVVKKSMRLGAGLGDRGCVSDDDGARVRVVQTGLEVVGHASGAGATTQRSSPPPPPPPRPHSTSPGGSAKQGVLERLSQRVMQTRTQPPKRILFYHAHDPYYGFTNFSPDPVEYKGKRYPTSEHLFQALKFLDHRPELGEHIRTCSPRPRVVFDETHRFNPEVRRDWLNVRIQMMDMVLWYKFTQNKHLKQELLSTGDAELVEDSDKDAFWGIGPDGKGENQLGKALERLREKLRNDVATKLSQ